MWQNAKDRAKRRDIPFTITPEDIIIPDECPVFRMPLAFAGGKQGGGPWSPSLDRIKPDMGYVSGNIEVVSRKFNCIKQDATAEELGMAAMYMLHKAQEKP